MKNEITFTHTGIAFSVNNCICKSLPNVNNIYSTKIKHNIYNKFYYDIFRSNNLCLSSKKQWATTH